MATPVAGGIQVWGLAKEFHVTLDEEQGEVTSAEEGHNVDCGADRRCESCEVAVDQSAFFPIAVLWCL